MADLPILFSAPMVRAILREIEQPGSGKTQTRRVLDMPPMTFDAVFNDDGVWYVGDAATGHHYAKLPVRYATGDRLYVREAHYLTDDDDYERVVYAAEDADVAEHLATISHLEGSHPTVNWSRHKRRRPPMHMPRWASRITLIVTDVRVQRLQEISSTDAVAEGVRSRLPDNGIAVAEFMDLWNGINGERPGCHWQDNPWVAAYTFRPNLGNIDEVRP